MFSGYHVICGTIDDIAFCAPLDFIYFFAKTMTLPMLGTSNSERITFGTLKYRKKDILLNPVIRIWHEGKPRKVSYMERYNLANKGQIPQVFKMKNAEVSSWFVGRGIEEIYAIKPANPLPPSKIDMIDNDACRMRAIDDLSAIIDKYAEIHNVKLPDVPSKINTHHWQIMVPTFHEFLGGSFTGKIRTKPAMNTVTSDGYKALEGRNLIYKHKSYFNRTMTERKLLHQGVFTPGFHIEVSDNITLSDNYIELLKKYKDDKAELVKALKPISSINPEYGTLIHTVWSNFPVPSLPPTIFGMGIPKPEMLVVPGFEYNVTMLLQLHAILSVRNVPHMIKDDMTIELMDNWPDNIKIVKHFQNLSGNNYLIKYAAKED